MNEQARLRPDMELIAAYCDERPEYSTGVRFENEPPVRIVAYFSDNLPHHLGAIRDLAEHPARVEVAQSRCSRLDQSRVVEEVRSLQAADPPGSRITGYGPLPDGVVRVMVLPGQEAFADELRQRFGDAVLVEPGFIAATS
jgi:hypothetical protein